MPKQLPWFKFYPAHWRAEQTLRVVSAAARGLWIECMCIMHEAEPYGHLVINDRPVTDTQLGLATGISPDQVSALMAELESAGVFSRTRTSVIYSRRMTRDEKRRKDGKTAKQTRSKVPGSRRSQPVENTGEISTTLKVVGKVEALPPSLPPTDSKSNMRGTREEKTEPSGSDKKKPCRLPSEWRLDPELVAWSLALPGASKAMLAETEDDFRDYWHAKPKDAEKADWPATWRRWWRKVLKDRAAGVLPMRERAWA